MRRIFSILLTFFCAGIILGVGYLIIVESGKKVLENGSTLEELMYEDTNSNIFYGKIDEEIELFPWNYYPEDDTSCLTGYYPKFQAVVFKGDIGEDEEELKALQNFYICELIAYESNSTTKEVWNWYEKQQKSIMNELKAVTAFPIGMVYFYQDILTLNEKQYQVKFACTEWNIISFVCIEYDSKEERDRSVWEEGKEKLVKVLEESKEQMSEYFIYMTYLRNGEITSIYIGDDKYANSYLESFQWLNNILNSEDNSTNISNYILEEILGYMSTEKYDKMNVWDVSVNYSYQIVELKDMILLLIQGDETIGLYYDPINQHFCGYNYFYEL